MAKKIYHYETIKNVQVKLTPEQLEKVPNYINIGFGRVIIPAGTIFKKVPEFLKELPFKKIEIELEE